MDEGTRIALVGLAAPAAIGLVAGVAALRPSLPPGSGRLSPADTLAWLGGPARVGAGATIAAVLAMSIALYVSQAGVHGPAGWPPASSDDRYRLLGAILGVGAFAGALALRATPSFGAGVLALLLGAAGVAAVLWPHIRGPAPGGDPWSVARRALVPGAFGLWALAAAWPLCDLLRRARRVSAAVILTGLALAVGAGLAGTGSLKLGAYALGFAAVCAGLLVTVLFRRGAAVGPAPIALGAGVLASYMSAGWAYSSTPPWLCAALAAVAPAAWIADRAVGSRLGAVGGGVVRIGVAAATAAAVIAPGLIGLATYAEQSSDDPYAGSATP